MIPIWWFNNLSYDFRKIIIRKYITCCCLHLNLICPSECNLHSDPEESAHLRKLQCSCPQNQNCFWLLNQSVLVPSNSKGRYWNQRQSHLFTFFHLNLSAFCPQRAFCLRSRGKCTFTEITRFLPSDSDLKPFYSVED